MSPGPPPTISTGPTPTEVTTAPSPSVSTIQQTEIPASTVIAIGLGFVALTTCGLLGLIGFRVLKVYMVVRRRRRNGEPDVQFRREWRRVGGMFGFMSGFNNGAGDSALIVGAGGVEMRRRLELLMLRENMQAANKPEMVEPTFWDTRIGSDLGGGEVEKMERWGILSLATPPPPPAGQINAPPLASPIVVSVLVAMPAPLDDHHAQPHTGGTNEDDMWELPDVMIGLTDISPTVAVADAPARGVTGGNTGRQGRVVSVKEKVDVEHVEHVSDAWPEEDGIMRRRAGWKKDRQGRWYVEGLRDL